MDRFIRGLIAGITGGIVMDIWDFFAYYVLKISTDRYLDWAAILTYGTKPYTLFSTISALIGQILFAGLMGVIVAYLVTYISSRHYFIKGAFIGFLSNFVLYAIPIAFKLPYLSLNPAPTAFSHLIGSILWGIVLMQMLHWLDNSPRVK